MITAEKKRRVIKVSDLNMDLILAVYMVLALEYDLYHFFHLKLVLPSMALTAMEIAFLIFVIITSNDRVKAHCTMYLFLLLGIAGTYLFSPECREYLQLFFFAGSSLKKVFLLPLAVHCINKPGKFVNRLYYFSIIEGYIHIFCNAVWGYGYTAWGVFKYMTYGAALLTPMCMVMQRVFSMPSKWNIITLIVFELNIIVYGHRGALLISMVMFSVFFLKYVRTKNKIIIGILGIIAFILLYIFKNALIETLISLMTSFNLESRTLEKLLSGDITNDSERKQIWTIMGKGIIENFPFGKGIGADRLLLGSAMRQGLYAHNFIFEICYNFGAMIGGIVVVCILIMVYKSLTQIQDENWYRLIVPFLIPAVVSLMTSGSIYQHWLFWLATGFYFCYFGRNLKDEIDGL